MTTAPADAAQPALAAPNAPSVDQRQPPPKIDHITSLQEGIDGLSLSLFEALRGLRDAVAPESGNLGGVQQQPNNAGGDGAGNSPTDSSENDFEEFCLAYQNGDPGTLALVQKISTTPPTRESHFRLLHEKIQEQKDEELVKTVAATVLEKSADIDRKVASLPGMHRTRTEQMKRIEELIEANRSTAARLEDAYHRAEQRRRRVRAFVRDHTCQSLGIIED
mmetsp:Transcript_5140/g.14958  ORF Transcript_5140/g.14958 Transcript_5140/m.14958 type:complete len:221 (+) Transcript_5140:339-1001(+)|eukprot:CAMPEP_0172375314 /NCGR_PEP_ID=MMETSP1060-20121228/60944_1 /TAXON_ID=37318 /ORGANISM="Pseudo-nitzschia pungens, Strain cf. cingulata" /LENGTH=220 /DNA_ID=CAMNT_0013102385 /DNA_START=266 /DNA_END=928 /DNA_ORIENTATION=+